MKLFFHYCVYGFSNTYLLGGEEGGEAILVDPGAMDVNLLNFIEKNNYYVNLILITHNHDNHVHGLKTLLRIYDAAIYSSNTEISEIPCRIIHDGDVLKLGVFAVKVFSVPGHSSDSVAYMVDRLIFTGDALTAGLLGQTASSYGSSLQLSNLQQKILNQEEDCILLPGHGPPSRIGTEKLFNIGLNGRGADQTTKRVFDIGL